MGGRDKQEVPSSTYLPQAALAYHTRLTWVFHPLSILNSSIYALLCSTVWKQPLSIPEVLSFLLKYRWSDEHDLVLLVSSRKCFSQKISYTSIIISWMLINGRPDPKYWAIGAESRYEMPMRMNLTYLVPKIFLMSLTTKFMRIIFFFNWPLIICYFIINFIVNSY